MVPNCGRASAGRIVSVAVFVALVIALALTPAASGQTITRQWIGAAAGDQFGLWMRWVGDVNADGFVDLAITEPNDSTTFPGAGKLRVFSGADGSTLYTWYGDQNNSHLGALGDPIGDVDLDGFDDVLTLEAFVPTGASGNVGRLFIFSGRDGSILRQIDGTPKEPMLGRLTGTGDLDADGVPDLAVTAGTTVQIRSGATGSVIRTLVSPHVHPDAFGNWVANAGDLDGDGVAELLVVEDWCYYNSADNCYAFSGANGTILWTAALDLCSSWIYTGINPRSIGDVNGDGIPDWAVGEHAVTYVFSGYGGGDIACHSGKDGSFLYWLHYPNWTPQPYYWFSQFGWSLAPAGDVNGDGVPDVVAGDGRSVDDASGDLYFFSGIDGTMLFHFRGLASAVDFGESVEGGFDVDHDGRLDVVGGDPEDATNGYDSGSAAQLSLGDLILDVTPHTVPRYATVRLAVNSGPPGNPLALFLVDLNGSPLFEPVQLTTFDSFRRWTLFYSSVSSSIWGSSVTLRALALDANGHLVVSNDETITFW